MLFVGILMAIVVMAGVLGNSMIFIVICWNKSLKRSVNIFLLNLAIADVGMVSTCMPYAIGAIVSKDQVITQTICYVNAFLVTTFATGTVLIITSLCLYQYLMVTSPLDVAISGVWSCFFLMSGWTLAFALASGPLFGWGEYEISATIFSCSYRESRFIQRLSYNISLMAMAYVFPLLIMIFCYTCILRTLRFVDVRLTKGIFIANECGADGSPETGQKRLVLVVVLIIIVFLVFRTPMFIFILLKTFSLVEDEWLALADQLSFWAIYFHAACDPFIYAFQHGEYCRTMKEIGRTFKMGVQSLCCCKAEQGEQDFTQN